MIMITTAMTILHHIEHIYEDPEAAFHLFGDDDDQAHLDDNGDDDIV